MTKDTQKFDVTDAIMTPWTMPGGRHFLFRSVLWAAAFLLLVYFILGRGIITAYIDFFQTIVALENAGNDDPAALSAMFGEMRALYSSLFLLSIACWVVMIMLETAMHKNIFHGIDNGVVPLRFGRDELRVMLAQFLVFLSFAGVYIGGIIVIAILAGIMGSVGGGGGAIAGLLLAVGVIAWFVLLVILSMRWAPASAMSVRDEKQRVFDGWSITEGIGWPLFGAYALIVIGGYVLINVVMVIGMVTLFSGLDFAALEAMTVDGATPDFSAITSHFDSAGTKIGLVVFLMVYTIVMLMWYVHIWGVANYVAQVDRNNNSAVGYQTDF